MDSGEIYLKVKIKQPIQVKLVIKAEVKSAFSSDVQQYFFVRHIFKT